MEFSKIMLFVVTLLLVLVLITLIVMVHYLTLIRNERADAQVTYNNNLAEIQKTCTVAQ